MGVDFCEVNFPAFQADDFFEVKEMKKAFKIPEVLDDCERAAILKLPNKRYPTGLRNAAIMTLMVDAGLRVSEALALKLTDIHWISGRIHVRQGKGKKDRILHVNEDALKLLQDWREIRPANGSELLFTTLAGGPIGDRYIRKMVKRYAEKAGIDKDIHPHSLRHTFATDLLKDSKNIRLVQQALGHADLSSTQIYTHIVNAELEAAMKSLRRERREED